MNRKKKKVDYIIGKNFNLFIFVGEICHVRKNPWNLERAKYWLRLSGGRFNYNEKARASLFAELFSGLNYNFIEAHFLVFKGKKLWNKLKKYMGTEHSNALRQSLRSFLPRFNKAWRQEKDYLMEIKKYLNDKSEKLDELFCDIKNLCGINSKSFDRADVPTHLAISSHHRSDVLGRFSVMGNRSDLVLECSHCLDSKCATFLSSVISHELFHIALRKNKDLKTQIEQISSQHQKELSVLSKDMKPSQILEELLISSFVPEGYLAFHYFGSKIQPVYYFKDRSKPINFVSARRFCAYHLRNMAKEYLINSKKIDQSYLLSLIDIIKNG